ncbi:MAG: helix-turn-helix domain-containing protein [Ruminococcaceae bacterium]|nr:helix-turn-helix domain-containing protein [Oscillospiraceae bacterium]
MKIQYETRLIDFSVRDASKVGGALGFGPHLHKHLEIVYMISGATRANVDTEVYTVESGDLLVVFPNKIHSYSDLQPSNKYILFFIDPYAIPDFSQKFLTMDAKSSLIKHADKNERMVPVIKALASYSEYPPDYKHLLLKGYLLSFCAEFMGMMDLNYTKSDEHQAMKTIVAYCSQNFTKELSLSVLEKELHLSKYYISHLFGDILNVKFTDYINSLRISEACRLLRATDHSITDIASMSGFGTLRTFNRAFIKRIGVSPTAYRRSKNSSNEDMYDIYMM